MASADILRAARARIEDPDDWIAGDLATAGDGSWVDPQDCLAECWCAVGALIREGGEAHGPERSLLNRHSKKLFSLSNVALVNDDSRLGHPAVMQVFDAAIAAAEAEAGR
ncbi:DUF6197 family protein [Methylorubrum extorquens]|uniref:Uncharacterized protein n=1 Tax=Methylorubrum extorquens DSM 13060 TaxID=882800 RepID=H1KCA3_METEX|nr:hypothetical protein [Methylorubrum extorquens]EHP94920.1 hypothetical protein MetexDRAFT_0265 [Methylorubrum extorquens DSM 13060]